MSEEYTILGHDNLRLLNDDDQTVGSNLFIKIDGFTSSDIKGYENYSLLKEGSESFNNNVHKEAQKDGTTAGGTISTGYVEVYLAHGLTATKVEKQGLGANTIDQIEICKTIVINEKRQNVVNMYYQKCHIVHFTYNFGTYQFIRFACELRRVQYSKIKADGNKAGGFGYTFSLKDSTVK